MTKRTPEQNRDDDFAAIMSGLTAHTEGTPGGADVRVHVPDQIDVKAIRRREGLTRAPSPPAMASRPSR